MAERIVNFSDPLDKARALSGFRNMEGKWRVSAVRFRKRRSDAQNRYMWGVVIPYVAAGLQEAWGEQLSAEDVHELLKSQFLPKRDVVNPKTGEVEISFPGSTTKLSSAEFNDYIEKIALFAAEKLSVAIPHPNEMEMSRSC